MVHGMAGEISEIRKEIEEMRERLRSLEQKLQKAQVGNMSEEERIKQVEAELKAKYSDASPDRELLAMVGTLPKPTEGYKAAVRRIVSERHK